MREAVGEDGSRFVAHQVREPVLLAGLDERVAALDSFAVEADDDLRLTPFLGVVRAVIPDLHVPRPVLPAGDVAGEVRVVEGVVLGVHGQPVLTRIGRQVLRHRPGDEHAVAFESEVVVQTAGMVLLDHEDRFCRRRAGCAGGVIVVGVIGVGVIVLAVGRLRATSTMLVVAEGFRGFRRIALGAVGAEVDDRARARVLDCIRGVVCGGCGVAGGCRGVVGVWCVGAVEPVEQIAIVGALEHLAEVQLCQARTGEFVPPPRCGGPRLFASAHRIRRERRLRRAVLAPIDEDTAGAFGFRHGRRDRLRVCRRERRGDFTRNSACGIGCDGSVEARVDVNSLAAAGHRIRSKACAVEHLVHHERHLRAFVE